MIITGYLKKFEEWCQKNRKAIFQKLKIEKRVLAKNDADIMIRILEFLDSV
jgi:hypothetical protein